MDRIELITAEVCPYAQRTHMALIEKGLDFERREVDLKNKPAWFEEVSPYSKVPVVKIGEKVVWESAIINEFIDESFPDRPMMPGDPYMRAQARIWIDFCNSRFAWACYDLVFAQDKDEQDRLRTKLEDDLRRMEFDGMAKLSPEGPFWLGSEISLVDLTYYPFFERFPAVSHHRGAHIPDECLRIVRWLEVMRERASVKATAHEAAYFIESYAKWANPDANPA